MRVIAGSAGGLMLKAPVNRELRPTSQKVKEALFNILQDRIPGCTFLDIFAGVGSIGIEALSRGAQQAFFIEKDRRALSFLRQNLEIAQVKETGTIIAGDAIKSIRQLRGYFFGIIFLDPPYNFVSYQEVLGCIMEKGILERGGIIIVEHYHKTRLELPAAGLFSVRAEKYGQTILSFLKSE